MIKTIAFLSATAQFVCCALLCLYVCTMISTSLYYQQGADLYCQSNVPRWFDTVVLHTSALLPLLIGAAISFVPRRKPIQYRSEFHRWFFYGTVSSCILWYCLLALCMALPKD